MPSALPATASARFKGLVMTVWAIFDSSSMGSAYVAKKRASTSARTAITRRLRLIVAGIVSKTGS